MVGRLHNTVIDCPDPKALATFYAGLLGLPVVTDDDDWVALAGPGGGAGLAFQQATNLREPRWSDPERPQQMHLDVMIDGDIEGAEKRVLAMGATPLGGSEEDGFRVYADPSGHPFCLCWN